MAIITKLARTATAAATLVAAGILWSGPGQATIVTTGCGADGCSLQELFNGGSILVNDKIFSGWGLERLNGSGLAPNFSNIQVQGLDDGGLDPGPGLQFLGNGELQVNNTDFIDFSFGFTVTVVGHFLIVDNLLQLLSGYQTTSGTGNVAIDECVRDVDNVNLGCKHVEYDPTYGIDEPVDFLEFCTGSIDDLRLCGKKIIHVEKDIYIEGRKQGDFAIIPGFIQRFSQVVPEPGTFTLLGIGLAGFGLLRKRSKTTAPAA